MKKVSEALGGISPGTAGEPGIPSDWVNDTALGSLRNAQPATWNGLTYRGWRGRLVTAAFVALAAPSWAAIR